MKETSEAHINHAYITFGILHIFSSFFNTHWLAVGDKQTQMNT